MVVHGRPGIRLRDDLPQHDGLSASSDAPVGAVVPGSSPDELVHQPAVYVVGLRQEGDAIALTQDAARGRGWGSGATQADDAAMEAVAAGLDGVGGGDAVMIATPTGRVTRTANPTPGSGPPMPRFDAVG